MPILPMVVDLFHGDNNDDKQVPIDFSKWKAMGIVGLIHKCTQGAGYADPLYARRRAQWMNGEKATIRNADGSTSQVDPLFGAYSFNTGEGVVAQVYEFLSHAEPDASTLMALDFEDNPRSQMSLAQMMQFLELADAKLGRKLVLYSGNRVIDLLGSQTISMLGQHRLWRPQYPLAPESFAQVRVQKSWQKPWLWQYSDRGQLLGCAGHVDLNAFDGSAADLAAQWA